VTEAVPAQLAALQFTPLSTYAQPPPTQFPVVPQVSVLVATHLPCGSGALSATLLQLPTLPATLQAMHASVHAWLQHTPWAQKPNSQSAAELQFAPKALSPQEDFVHCFPDTHWVSLVQRSKQVLPLHRYGLQLRVPDVTHRPEVLHVKG
jgi:hypothetical protein